MTNLTTQIKTWGTNQKRSGATGLALVLSACDQMNQEHPNGDPMLQIIGKQTNWDETAVRTTRLILGQVFGGISLVVDKGSAQKKAHQSGYRFKYGDNFGPSEEMEKLRSMVDEGVSIRSITEIKSKFGIETKKTDFDLDKKVKTIVAWMKKEGISESQLQAKVHEAFTVNS